MKLASLYLKMLNVQRSSGGSRVNYRSPQLIKQGPSPTNSVVRVRARACIAYPARTFNESDRRGLSNQHVNAFAL